MESNKSEVEIRLPGRTVLVTGSSRNLGFTIALEFAKAGSRVILHGPSEAEVGTAKEAVEARFPGALVESVVFDLASEAAIDRGFAELAERELMPDVLVNNAAHLAMGSPDFFNQSVDFFRQVLEVNLMAPFRCSQLAAIAMRERGGGSIVHISSLAGERSIHGRCAYNVSKAAIDGLTRSMAVELAPHGIRVNAIAPGYIWTPRWLEIEESAVRQRLENIPMAKATEQEEIARLVLFLVSGGTPTLTGARLVIDGGLNAQQLPGFAMV